jgi:hypothetical protein
MLLTTVNETSGTSSHLLEDRKGLRRHHCMQRLAGDWTGHVLAACTATILHLVHLID